MFRVLATVIERKSGTTPRRAIPAKPAATNSNPTPQGPIGRIACLRPPK